MKNEDSQDVREIFRAESARVLIFFVIYIFSLAGYMFVLRGIPFSAVLPIFIVLFMHFFYMKYGSKNEISPLCNYSPIWSSVSILFFVLIFISEIYIGKGNVTLVIGIFGAIVISIIYMVAIFIIYQDLGL